MIVEEKIEKLTQAATQADIISKINEIVDIINKNMLDALE